MENPVTVANTAEMAAKITATLSDILTAESAQRILDIQLDANAQARIQELARGHNAGTLSWEERDEYGTYVQLNTYVRTMKSKARLLLKQSQP